MGLIDKFKNKDEQEKLASELKSKVGKEEKKEVEKNQAKAEVLKNPAPKRVNQPQQTESRTSKKIFPKLEEKGDDKIEEQENLEVIHPDDLELLVNNFLDQYPSSKKESRMIRLQESNYNILVKLKVHNIKLSDFVNFAINFTTKSPDYARILKLLKNPK